MYQHRQILPVKGTIWETGKPMVRLRMRLIWYSLLLVCVCGLFLFIFLFLGGGGTSPWQLWGLRLPFWAGFYWYDAICLFWKTKNCQANIFLNFTKPEGHYIIYFIDVQDGMALKDAFRMVAQRFNHISSSGIMS